MLRAERPRRQRAARRGMSMTTELDGRRVTVMGLGRFGGGAGVTRFLAGRGARVLVTDVLPAERLALPEIADLIEAGAVTTRLGGHDPSDFARCDLVVANPAVPRPWANPLLAAAERRGVPITTEIRLLVERLDRRRAIGVTGTAGKSTTTAMIGRVMEGARWRVHVGGNLGGSLLSRLDAIGPDDWVVLELSSAMLHWLGAGAGAGAHPGWSPRVAVLTNLAPNHLDWHGTLTHYALSKRNIFRYQEAGDAAIDPSVLGPGPAPRLSIPGAHNAGNARLAAAAAAAAAGVDQHEAEAALRGFAGLPHRLQLVAASEGRRFYNDSKSTTPQATQLAVDALGQPRTVHLVAGGYDKGIDLGAIAELAPKLAGLYTIGATGEALARAAAGGRAEYCRTLEAAASRALTRMGPGDALLLSPGCASWDQYENYEKRGEAFVRWVGENVYSYPNSARSSSSSPK